MSQGAISEFRWWERTLRSEAMQQGVPLASRSIFPIPSDPHVLVPYSDASREKGADSGSGFGAWAVMAGTIFYVEGRWSDAEVARLDINTLELVAMNIGSFTFLREAQRMGLKIEHLLEFTDNTSAEYAMDRGKPKAPRLGELVTRRYDALYAANVFGAAERIASEDNDIADGLSRGGDKLADALRMAAAANLPLQRLDPHEEWRNTAYLMDM